MRVIRELSYPEFKATFFSWNNRYLIKLEQGLLEQTYKVDQFDIGNEQELVKVVDSEFIQQAANRFLEMHKSMQEAMARIST